MAESISFSNFVAEIHVFDKMIKNLVIVESPAKAKTIEKFLGKDYKVMSSYGHIRDLSTVSYTHLTLPTNSLV